MQVNITMIMLTGSSERNFNPSCYTGIYFKMNLFFENTWEIYFEGVKGPLMEMGSCHSYHDRQLSITLREINKLPCTPNISNALTSLSKLFPLCIL